MNNYVDERAKHIQHLTRQHQAYFDICKQELRTDIQVLRDLIWDIEYIIGDLCYDKDFFNPQQLAHLEAINETYLQQLASAQQELARIDPPQWSESVMLFSAYCTIRQRLDFCLLILTIYCLRYYDEA
jgi:hypothetical protein